MRKTRAFCELVEGAREGAFLSHQKLDNARHFSRHVDTSRLVIWTSKLLASWAEFSPTVSCSPRPNDRRRENCTSGCVGGRWAKSWRLDGQKCTAACCPGCLWAMFELLFYLGNVLQAATSTTPLSMSSVDGMIGVSTEAGGAVFDPLGLAELHSINPLVNPHPKVSYFLTSKVFCIWHSSLRNHPPSYLKREIYFQGGLCSLLAWPPWSMKHEREAKRTSSHPSIGFRPLCVTSSRAVVRSTKRVRPSGATFWGLVGLDDLRWKPPRIYCCESSVVRDVLPFFAIALSHHPLSRSLSLWVLTGISGEQWLQEAEIKHCRICMLAFVGILSESRQRARPRLDALVRRCCAQRACVFPFLGALFRPLVCQVSHRRWPCSACFLGPEDPKCPLAMFRAVVFFGHLTRTTTRS